MKLYSSIDTYIIVIQQSVSTFSEIITLSESRVAAASYLVSFFLYQLKLSTLFLSLHSVLFWQVQDSNPHCRGEVNGSVLAHPKTFN